VRAERVYFGSCRGDLVTNRIHIGHSAAAAIAATICLDGSHGRARHLLHDRLLRLEVVAGRRLDHPQALHAFLAGFLLDAEVYFSYLRLSPTHPLPSNVYSLAAHKIETLIESVKSAVPPETRGRCGFGLSLHLSGLRIGDHRIIEKTYLYAIKNGCTLVLGMAISGSLVPQALGDTWNLTFDIAGITFLNFESTSDFIRSAVLTDERLRRYNARLSWVFMVFSEQASDWADRGVEEELDREALATLSTEERDCLGIYMPIFDRYGEADNRILEACESANAAFPRVHATENQWIMSSPSYSLPTWFVRFVRSLPPAERAFLESLDLNHWSDPEVDRIVAMVLTWGVGLTRP
jgi:hypothetical protein